MYFYIYQNSVLQVPNSGCLFVQTGPPKFPDFEKCTNLLSLDIFIQLFQDVRMYEYNIDLIIQH
jgi:hypothetical protein